jgi:hypothetical protein
MLVNGDKLWLAKREMGISDIALVRLHSVKDNPPHHAISVVTSKSCQVQASVNHILARSQVHFNLKIISCILIFGEYCHAKNMIDNSVILEVT